MTENRRKDDRHPNRPLDWSDTETLAGQQWKAPASPSAAPAAGQAGLAKSGVRAAIERALEDRHIEDGSVSAFNDVVDCIERELLAAPVAADTEQTTDGREGFWTWEQRAEAAEAFLLPYADVNGEKLLGDYHVQPIIRQLAAAILEWQKAAYLPAPEGRVGLATPADAGAGPILPSAEIVEQVRNAMRLAMDICDAVPNRAHQLPEGEPLRHLGLLVNCQEETGAHGYAVIRDAKEAFERFAADADMIPEGAARSSDGTTYHNIAEIYHRFEDGEALHMWLDDKGVPRADADGKVFSLVGRVARMPTSPAPVTAEPAQQWISVDERLPEPGQQVIAYRPTAAQTNDDPVRLVRYTGHERESWQNVKHGFDCICHPTHWMPLPAQPDKSMERAADAKGDQK